MQVLLSGLAPIAPTTPIVVVASLTLAGFGNWRRWRFASVAKRQFACQTAARTGWSWYGKLL